MKFLLFSDLHHFPSVFDAGTNEDLKIIQNAAEENNCDFIVHAGDFCHGPSHHKEFVSAYNDFHIPSYHCLGNHDTDRTPLEETLKAYNMSAEYYYFDNSGYRFIIMSTNYYFDGEQYVPYSLGNYYKYPNTREAIPQKQIDWLKETIESSQYPCIIISHASLERPDGAKGREKVLEVIDEANQKKKGSVLMCINGHHHADYVRILNGVVYFDMNSVSYHYLSKAHDLFPKEMREKYADVQHTIIYSDPLFAIVELEDNKISVKGMESTFFMNIDMEKSGNGRYDGAARAITPTIQSFTFVCK